MRDTTSGALVLVAAMLVGCRGGDTVPANDATSTTESSTESSTESGDSSTTTDTEDTGTDTTDETETGDPLPECGDGTVDPDEECDDGNFVDDDGCTNACNLPICGDDIVQDDEACDMGPENGPGQLCNARCQLNVCGDGDPGPGESCDDGNAIDDDACPNNCVLASCGNGVIDPGEQCEDGDMDPGDGCTNACLYPVCGDGVVWVGHEACDDGNGIEDDECTSQCELPSCGDDILQAGEECEDGNEESNDGCFACLEQRVLAVEAMSEGACVLLDGGVVRCWGHAFAGQLGYGNTENIGDNEHPYTAGDVDIGGSVVQLDSGSEHSCVLLDSGAVRCWGGNWAGHLGYGNFDSIGDDEPASAGGDVDVGGNVVQISAGAGQTCALLDTGSVRCWGIGLVGMLGYGNQDDIGDDELPASAGDVDVGGVVVQIRTGAMHTCALLDSGSVRCWGDRAHGYPNIQTVGDDETPASLGDVDIGGVVVDLALGGEHSCALLDGGAVRCWGRNTEGQLGYGHTMYIGDNETPASAGDVPLGAPAVQISAGGRHNCALLDDGAVRCWGLGTYGKLGYGNVATIGDNEAPSMAGDVDVGAMVESISCGGLHTCVLTVAGVVRCWGGNYYGHLGLGHDDPVGDNELPSWAPNVKVYE